MKTASIPERIDIIKDAMKITEDVEFGRLAGMSKSVVNQLRSGGIKSISAKYAYSLEDNTGFSSRWIQTGEGIQRLSMSRQNTEYASDPLLDDLAALDPDDAAMFKNRLEGLKIEIKRAAKAARKLHEESDRHGASGTGDPPLERWRAA
jgi:hypothetical protein